MAGTTYNDVVASILAVMVTAAVIYLAVISSSPEVVTATTGALTLGLGLVMGWHFRGRVQPPAPPTP